MIRDIFNSIRLLRAPCNLILSVSRDGASTTSLGNLHQCFTTLIIENLFLTSALNLAFFGLKPLPLVLSHQALLTSLSPSMVKKFCPTAVAASPFEGLDRDLLPAGPSEAAAGWWGTFAAWRWGFRCKGFCQHPGDFHKCSGAGRKNKFSLASPYGFVFPISRLLGSGLRPPAPVGCWNGKGDFVSSQILVQGQNLAQADARWRCGPSEQWKEKKPLGTGTPQARCSAASQARTVFFLQSPLGLAVILKHLLQIIQDYRN